MVNDLRLEGVSALTDLEARSVKAQMKYANKKNAMFTMVLGPDEISGRRATVKNMDNGETTEISLDAFSEDFMHVTINAALAEMDLGAGDIDLNNLTLLTGGKE